MGKQPTKEWPSQDLYSIECRRSIARKHGIRPHFCQPVKKAFAKQKYKKKKRNIITCCGRAVRLTQKGKGIRRLLIGVGCLRRIRFHSTHQSYSLGWKTRITIPSNRNERLGRQTGWKEAEELNSALKEDWFPQGTSLSFKTLTAESTRLVFSPSPKKVRSEGDSLCLATKLGIEKKSTQAKEG